MKKALVSIITPCYNMEKVLHRLMDSIIAQTYRPIEFILVDDGSTDNSLSVAERYREKMTQAGIDYIVVHQDNQGLGGAINAGLSFVTGEYLCWPDADDYLEPYSVADRVAAFIEHPECAVVTSNAFLLEENDMENKKIMVDGSLKIHNDPKQFLYHLNAESIFCSGCHMVKTEKFFEVNPDKSIYPARRGQNWQMLLPLYFKYDRFFLDKPLYNYVISPNSMSRGDDGYESWLYRFNEHETILRKTIQKIEKVQNADMTEYSRFLDDKYAKLRMDLALRYKKKDEFIKEYRDKQINVGLDTKDIFNYIRYRFPILDKPMTLIYRILRGDPSDIGERLRYKLITNYTVKQAVNPKVAVLIPVFNGAKFIDQCFYYLLNQRYDNIEVIVVNDGSTDESEELLCKYEEVFAQRGFSYRHLQQPNSRLAIAMNNALQYVTAEYIMIYEIDDVLYRDGIIDKVRFLQNNQECIMVRNNGYYINSFQECGKRLFVNQHPDCEDERVFERILDGTANNWPASYMIRKDAFFSRLGYEHKIYEHPGGCHLQFMMPMAYKSKVGFIDKPLMGYYVHIDSDSHSGGTQAAIKRTYQYGEIRSEMVRRIDMPLDEKHKYLMVVDKLYDKVRLNYALTVKDRSLYEKSARNLGWNKLKQCLSWTVGTGIFGKIIDFTKRGMAAVLRKCRNFICNMKYIKQNNKSYL